MAGIDRDCFAGAGSAVDDAREFVTDDERGFQLGVPDAALRIPVKIRTAQSHRCHTDQGPADRDLWNRFVGHSQIPAAVQPRDPHMAPSRGSANRSANQD